LLALAGDDPTDEAVDVDRGRIAAGYEETAADREQDRRELINRLAKGQSSS